MKTKIFITSILSCLLIYSCNKQTTLPVSLTWEMGQNGIKPGVCEQTFYIKNTGKTELKDNWVIYFNQISTSSSLPDDSAALVVERISSTYFKMYPTENYKPISPNETFKFTFLSKGAVIKESTAPQGVYIVFTDENGKEQTPQNIAIELIPFTKDYQWTRKNTKEIPYPDGNYMYEQNAFFQTPTELTETDIFPSIKKITKSEGTSLFTKNIKIEHDSEFANEAELLKEKLSSLFGCTVSENGETTVKLTHPNAKLADIKDSYRINVNDNVFEISAGNAKGVFYGCQTLIQILGNFENLPSQISNMDIFDYPDADYRAQMLDVARNFTSKENILKLLDVLSSYKISVFHFHISDDEAWRVEIPGLEELTTVGSRRGHTHDERECLYPAFSWGWDASDKNTLANGYYTRNEFIEILKFAEKRHIKVIPEIDMPGHSRSAIKAMNARYFKYIDTDKAKAEEYLLEDFADTSKYVSAQNFTDNVINVAMPSTYHFVEKIIDEIDKMYSDAGLQLEIFHLGGDEVPNGSWEGSALCTDFMKANNMTEIRELKDYFVEQVLEMFKKRDIQLAAWQDVVSFRNGNPNPKFSDSNILSYCWNTQPVWNSDDIPYKLANAGYPIIFCNVTNFYFDMSYNKHPNEPGLFWGGFVNEFTSFDVLPYDIYKSVRRDLSGNLVDINEASKTKIPLSKDAHNNIIGLQGVFFAETLRSFEQLERNLFPKMFGLIERSWNMTPDWALTQDNSAYENAKQTYNAKITKKEMPRLSKLNVNFRVEQPGIKIENGLLYANTSIADAVIRYTTDGNEPTEKSAIWTSPIECNAKQIKAKTFYIGKESLTTLLANE